MEPSKTPRVSSLLEVQSRMLELLSGMRDELECLAEIDNAGPSVAKLRRYNDDIKSIIISFGERFSDESQPIESYQKIAYKELFDENVSLENMKEDASGKFGKVLFKEYRGQKVAVKIQKTKEMTSLKNEVKTLRTISHDNIISFRGWGEHTDNLGNHFVFLVMEHLDKDLQKYVNEQTSDDNKGLSSRITWEISKQIAQALNYLHNLEIPIVHADLKPDNILVDTKLIIPKPKLCDFGLSRHEYLAQHDGTGEERGKGKGHRRYRPVKKEFDAAKNITDYLKIDVFGFGLIVLFMRTGSVPCPDDETRDMESVEIRSPLKLRSNKEYYVRGVKIPDLPDTVLGDLVLKCCGVAEDRPLFKDIVPEFFGKGMKNPFNLAEKGEFFECGFLKDTQIFVADSIVEDSTTESYKPSAKPPGYRREDLICAVEVFYKPYNDKPEEEELYDKYMENYTNFRKMAENKKIDDNPAVALSKLITDRSGDDEAQKIELEYKEKTYCHHRAMREIWRSFETKEKVTLLPCLSEVNSLYSTSFGLHVAILTNEGPGKTKKFVFTRRSNKPGVASPGSYTCGAVESCSIKDYLNEEKKNEFILLRRAEREEKRKDKVFSNDEEREDGELQELEERERDESMEYVSLIDTAARGLEEELGLPLLGSDKDAITLNTIYLKFDNHEWGMCGFVDLTNEKIREENRFSFAKLNAAFTSGPKDKFEHWQIHGVDFELRTMVEWIRAEHDKLASSAKIVVVKVLQAFFGTAAVTNAFERKM